MLPSMPELMPPFPLYYLALVDLFYGPQLTVRLVEENGLENMSLEWDRGYVGVVIHAELMLIVGAVERHLNLLRVLSVGMREVHWSVPARFAVLADSLVSRKFDLPFLILGLGLCTKSRFEAGFVICFKVFGVRVGDGDVVEESGTAQYKPFSPCRRFPQQLFRIVSQDCHDELVESFGFRDRAGMLARPFTLFRIEGGSL